MQQVANAVPQSPQSAPAVPVPSARWQPHGKPLIANAAQQAWYERPQSPTALHVLLLSTLPQAAGPSTAVAFAGDDEAAAAAQSMRAMVVKRTAEGRGTE